MLKSTANLQKRLGLNINWVPPSKIEMIIPGINKKGLLGGTYSPNDGNCNPMKANIAFKQEAES